MIDESTNFVWANLLREMSEVKQCFQDWLALIKNQFGAVPKCVRSDNGVEYISNDLARIFKDRGIIHQTIVADSPQQNEPHSAVGNALLDHWRKFV